MNQKVSAYTRHDRNKVVRVPSYTRTERKGSKRKVLSRPVYHEMHERPIREPPSSVRLKRFIRVRNPKPYRDPATGEFKNG